MLAPSSASKYTNFQFQVTPAKLTVDYEINSWNETHSKKQVLYRHKRRKILRAIEQSQVKQSKNTTNLAQLRSYKENLLKSTAKKLSERTLPTPSPISNPSTQLTRSSKSGFRINVKSLSRSSHQQKDKVIVVSQFDPNVEVKQQHELNLQFKLENKMIRISQKMLGRKEKTVSIPKRKTSGNNRCVSVRGTNYGQGVMILPHQMENPNGVSLVTRKLISSRV